MNQHQISWVRSIEKRVNALENRNAIECMNTAVLKKKPEQELTDWRPINHGPKENPWQKSFPVNTPIIIARAGWECYPVAVYTYYPGNPVMDSSGNDVHMFGWKHDCTGFTYGMEDYWLGWEEDPMPTHWMPCCPSESAA